MRKLCSKIIEGQEVVFFVDDEGFVTAEISGKFANVRGLPRRFISTEKEFTDLKGWLEGETFLSRMGSFIEINAQLKGGWGEDIHSGLKNHGGTYRWAQDIFGNGSTDASLIAREIAIACSAVDSWPSTNPVTCQGRHFNTAVQDGKPVEGGMWDEADRDRRDTRLVYAEQSFTEAVSEWRVGSQLAPYKTLAIGLHSLQDMFAHDDSYVTISEVTGTISQIGEFLSRWVRFCPDFVRHHFYSHVNKVGTEADNPLHNRLGYFRSIPGIDPGRAIADQGKKYSRFTSRYYDTQAATCIYLSLFRIAVAEDKEQIVIIIRELNEKLRTLKVTAPRLQGFLDAFKVILGKRFKVTFNPKRIFSQVQPSVEEVEGASSILQFDVSTIRIEEIGPQPAVISAVQPLGVVHESVAGTSASAVPEHDIQEQIRMAFYMNELPSAITDREDYKHLRVAYEKLHLVSDGKEGTDRDRIDFIRQLDTFMGNPEVRGIFKSIKNREVFEDPNPIQKIADEIKGITEFIVATGIREVSEKIMNKEDKDRFLAILDCLACLKPICEVLPGLDFEKTNLIKNQLISLRKTLIEISAWVKKMNVESTISLQTYWPPLNECFGSLQRDIKSLTENSDEEVKRSLATMIEKIDTVLRRKGSGFPRWTMIAIKGNVTCDTGTVLRIRQEAIHIEGAEVEVAGKVAKEFLQGWDIAMVGVKNANIKGPKEIDIKQYGASLLQPSAKRKKSALPAASSLHDDESMPLAPERSPSPPTDDDVELINELKWLISKKYSGKFYADAIGRYIKPYCDEGLDCSMALKGKELAQLNRKRDELVEKLKPEERTEYEAAKAQDFTWPSAPVPQ